MPGDIPKKALEPPKCPICGGDMKMRQGRSMYFWGCSGYPNCKGTIKIDHKPPDNVK
jgi:DNA topoisomerase III